MADTAQNPQPEAAVDAVLPTPLPHTRSTPRVPRREALNKLYSLPAPLRTFPLPTFIPHNPISYFYVFYSWLSQSVRPQSSTFDPTYYGWWSPETRSVHVTDSRSIRGLWEQGFYGKGNLSRSEPNWLDKEKPRRGTKAKVTSEEITRKRREERQQTKWERARKEREAIDQRRLAEAEEALREAHITCDDPLAVVREISVDSDSSSAASEVILPISVKFSTDFLPPVGPLELLALPNSATELIQSMNNTVTSKVAPPIGLKQTYAAPVGPLQLLALPNSLPCTELPPSESDHSDHVSVVDEIVHANGYMNGHANGNVHSVPVVSPVRKENGDASIALAGHGLRNTHSHETSEAVASEHSDDSSQTSNFAPNGSALVNGNGSSSNPKIRRQKSVRFSPTVEKNTFIQSEPPSPERTLTATATADIHEEPTLEEDIPDVPVEEEPILNKEHFQLTMEEAFFLTYGLGALTILDPTTKSPINNQNLFNLFRHSSHFPPTAKPSLSPDDPFLLNYIVYHHYRSLGWVVRGGAKFSCDFMLYNRGPVFSHAEFAIIVLPSYNDAYWSSDVFLQNYVKKKEHRTWAWMHCINRVITQAKKSLILVYVDIPKPLGADRELELGVDELLERYQVREFVMKRWQMNRERGNNKQSNQK